VGSTFHFSLPVTLEPSRQTSAMHATAQTHQVV
jgi:hypothetical protein